MGRVRDGLFRPWTAVLLAGVTAVAGFGLYWFQPWKLWQDETGAVGFVVLGPVCKVVRDDVWTYERTLRY